MLIHIGVVLVCVAIAACAVRAPPDTALIPPGAFGTFDNDVGAANQASWAFAAPSRTLDDPVDAARAAAGIDFLAGELSRNPRWIMVSPLIKQEMLQARTDVRRVLGIASDAPSQFVVEALLQFAWLWQFGNPPAAIQAIATPIFTLPPQQTLQVLTNLPYVRSANIASAEAVVQMLPGG